MALGRCCLLGCQYSELVEAVKEYKSIVAWSVIDKAYALCPYKEGAEGVPNIRADKHLTRPAVAHILACVSRSDVKATSLTPWALQGNDAGNETGGE